MPRLDVVKLRVGNVKAQRRFYCEVLGMQDTGGGDVGYGSEEAKIRFLPAESAYIPQSGDLYWKIAIAVPDIELAAEQLKSKGIEVSTPGQFQDVGYLAHFNDPEGFTIELIDHWFKGERPDDPGDDNLLGGGAHLNLVTLRTTDIVSDEQLVTGWGMQPLCVQPVTSHGFTLYFYAFTSEQPPSGDLRALENRAWLYRRPYTILELQHVHDLGSTSHTKGRTAGYAGIGIAGFDVPIQQNGLLVGRE